MKKTTFMLLFLLSISYLGLLQSCHKAKEAEVEEFKPKLHKYTNDGKVLTDNSPSPNHICIYLSNGGKIERTCYSGEYWSWYLTPVSSDSGKERYKQCWDPTDRLMIAFYNNNWLYDDTSYNDDLYTYLWSLHDELDGKVVIDWNLVHRYKKKWDSSNEVWIESHTYSPLIQNGSFAEIVNNHQQRGFSVNPKYIKKIELWHNE